MTALALDVRELSFEELDQVGGGDADRDSFVQSVAAGLYVVALVTAPVITIGVTLVVITAVGATAAY